MLLKAIAHKIGKEGSFNLDLCRTFAPKLRVQLKPLAKVAILDIVVGFSLELRGEEIIKCGTCAVFLLCICPETVGTQVSELVWNECADFWAPGISCSALLSPRENPGVSQWEVLRLTGAPFGSSAVWGAGCRMNCGPTNVVQDLPGVCYPHITALERG